MLLLLACADAPETGTPAPADDTAADTDTDTTPVTVTYTSCAELLAVLPDTPDGPVTIELADGTRWETYCEMDLAGGGWTLAGTNSWEGGWTEENVLTDELFGTASLTSDYKGPGFSLLPFSDLLFENDTEYASYDDVGDGTTSYKAFQDTVPIDNCGINTDYVWQMTEGDFADPDLCETALYINVKDWEGGLIPCNDSESAPGPAWSTKNKDLGCPLNDPLSSCFAVDYWDYNPWGDHVAETLNQPLRMWVR